MADHDFEITVTTNLPARDAIMITFFHFSFIFFSFLSTTPFPTISVMCESNWSQCVEMAGEKQSMFKHVEADVSITSYLFMIIQIGIVQDIQLLCYDTDRRISPALLVLEPNTKCADHHEEVGWQHCTVDNYQCHSHQVGTHHLAIHVLTGCDTTLFPQNRSKRLALNVLMELKDLG